MGISIPLDTVWDVTLSCKLQSTGITDAFCGLSGAKQRGPRVSLLAHNGSEQFLSNNTSWNDENILSVLSYIIASSYTWPGSI